MTVLDPKFKLVIGTLLLASVLWFLIFGMQLANFWVLMSLSTGLLALLVVAVDGWPFKRADLNWRNLVWGVLSAAVLYFVFWVGNEVARLLFAFTPVRVGSIYSNKAMAAPWVIAILLAVVIGPGEEIYWRAFVQRYFVARWGVLAGILLAAVVYALVHIWAFNLILLVAALVSGIFWGWLYQRTGSIVPGIVSHALWDVAIFILFPMQ